MTYKNCPTILACSIEFNQIKPRSEQAAKQLQAIKTDDATKELIPAKATGKLAEILNQPTLCIILGYMLRMSELDESLREDLEIILSKATYMIEMMITVANMMRMEFMMRNIPKRIPARTVLSLISFSQNLVQGMWYDDDPFLQLPFVDYEKLQNFRKKNKNISLEAYAKMTREERQTLGMYEDSAQFEDSEKALEAFPLIDINVSYAVEGEQEVAVGDFLTIKLVVTHVKMQDKQSLGFVHSNKFPYLKRSSWYMVFTDPEENDMLAMDKLVITEKVHTKEIKERMQKPGVINLTILLRNDSYRGFDKRIDLRIPVLAEVKRAPVEYDEEDIQAQKAPSLMQQMMEVNPEGSDDEEESDDEPVQATPATTASQSTEKKKEK